MRYSGALVMLALCAAPRGALAQHHGGSHSHSGSHFYSYTPHSHSYSRPPSYHHHSYASSHYGASKSHVPRPTHSNTPAPGSRDEHGRLKRSEKAKRKFERETGHPHGWPGHVVDHKVPLACGGADAPSNMQWQTTAEAKAKDKVERRGCR